MTAAPTIRRPPIDQLVLIGAAVAWSALCAWRFWPTSALSWHFFRDGSQQLLHSSGLSLYADHPGYQIGPVAFLAASLVSPLGANGARIASQLLMTAAGPLCLAALWSVIPRHKRRRRMAIATFVLIPPWAILSVRWSHLDDVLAMLFTVLALRAVRQAKPGGAGALIGLAAASKPWAIDFAPMLLAFDRKHWKNAFGWLLGVLLLTWGPFVVAAPSTLAALKPSVLLAQGSGLYALGVRGQIVPAWDRTLAFVAAIGAATFTQLRGRWPGVIVTAVAVRIALDPQNNAYYVGSIALSALVYDLFATRTLVPWLTLVSTVIFWQPFTADWDHRVSTTTGYAHWWFTHLDTVGYLHLAWCVAVPLLVWFGPKHRGAAVGP